MAAITIAPVSRRDVKAIARIEDASFPEPWSEAVVRSEIDQQPQTRRYTKAIVAGDILGYLGLMYVDDEIHVNTIAPVPASHRRGVATLLLLDGIEASLQRGGRRLTLEVAASNTAAQGLYRKFGLAPVGIRKGYYAGGEDAIVMWSGDLDDPAERARRASMAASLGSTP